MRRLGQGSEMEIHRIFWESCARGLVESPNATWLFFASNDREAGGVSRWITGPLDRIIEVGDKGICDSGPT